MLGFPKLATRCLTLLCQQNKNLEQNHPDFYSLFSALNEGVQQSIALQELQKQPAGEIAKLPFFEGASEAYLALLCNASKELLNNGSEKVYLTLLEAFQHINLPESISVNVKSLLVQFLEEKGSTAKAILEGVCDNDLLIEHALKALKNLLIEKAELVESQTQLIRNTHRFLKEEDTKRFNRLIDFYDMFQEEIDTNFEEIQLIYSYLKDNVDSIDEQLLDDAVELCMQNELQTANHICQVMIDSKDAAPNSEAQYLQKIFPTNPEKVSKEFAAYLIDYASTRRPNTAYYLGKIYCGHQSQPQVIEKNEEKGIECFCIAAVQKHKQAIDELNTIAKKCIVREKIATLGDPDHVNWEKQVKQLAEKIVRGIRYWGEAYPHWLEHERRFRIDRLASFERRLEIGSKSLTTNQLEDPSNNEKLAFMGVEILETLSKLDHSLAPEAKQILHKWLIDPNHKVWVIKQYAIQAGNFVRRCGE